jgi:uncharacterized protein (UPF0276 family)
LIERRAGLGFVELTSENFPLELPLPEPVLALRRRGVTLVPHGLGLSLGSATRPDPARIKALANQAIRTSAPLVSEHIAFVRAEGEESGHLMPVPRTREMVRVLVENIKEAMDQLPVPLALENISTLFEWPGAELSEEAFIREVLDASGALLLLDVENLYANSINHRFDAHAYIDGIGVDRIAYCHIAGGSQGTHAYHDTHSDPVPKGVLDLLTHLASRTRLRGYMLERDGAFDAVESIAAELDAIDAAVATGQSPPTMPPP